jgi:septal ring factor EnvC (AmiA/AmiB activator)
VKPSWLTVGFLLLWVWALPVSGQRKEDPTLKEKERTLQRTQKQLREERARAAEARKREASVLAELESIDRKLADERRELVRLDGRIRKAEAEVAALVGDIKGLE